MSMFAYVTVEDVELPGLPAVISDRYTDWQSKTPGLKYYGPFRITWRNGERVLLHEETKYTEKTDQEKQVEAAYWGFDSWDEYVTVYEEYERPDFVESGSDGDGNMESMFPPVIAEQVDPLETVRGPEDAPDWVDTVPVTEPNETYPSHTVWKKFKFNGVMEFHTIIEEKPVSWEELAHPLTMSEVEGDESREEKDEPPLKAAEFELETYIQYEADVDDGVVSDIRLDEDRRSRTDESALTQIQAFYRAYGDDVIEAMETDNRYKHQ